MHHCAILKLLAYESHMLTHCMSCLGLVQLHLSVVISCRCGGNTMACMVQGGTVSLPHPSLYMPVMISVQVFCRCGNFVRHIRFDCVLHIISSGVVDSYLLSSCQGSITWMCGWVLVWYIKPVLVILVLVWDSPGTHKFLMGWECSPDMLQVWKVFIPSHCSALLSDLSACWFLWLHGWASSGRQSMYWSDVSMC
jgi:hypothetical protein